MTLGYSNARNTSLTKLLLGRLHKHLKENTIQTKEIQVVTETDNSALLNAAHNSHSDLIVYNFSNHELKTLC